MSLETIKKQKPFISDDTIEINLNVGKPKKTDKKSERKEFFLPKADGLYHVVLWEKDGKETNKEEVRIGDPLFIKAKTRETGNEGWGVLLEWQDPDKMTHEYIMPLATLSMPGNQWFSPLIAGGYTVDPAQAALIKKYLATYPVRERARIATKTGWIEESVFVLPDAAIGGKEGEKIILSAGAGAAYRQGGTLEEWKKLAELAKDNSRLIFALSAALAGPLLYITGQESGGFNFVGASSTGKSTALRLAASVWGGPEHVKSWRTTDNAAESTAVFHNDSLLILDELGQASARTCSEMSYMLSNGAGKTRASRDGTARAVQTWRVLFLSSGELGLADKLAEAGQKPKAGQEVRLVDLPADAGEGIGLFDRIPAGMTPGGLATKIKELAKSNFGIAGREFVQALCVGGQETEKEIRDSLAAYTASICPAGADGQVQRVAARFALCAAAGAFACRKGILPLSEADVKTAIEKCFKSWILNRGGIGAGEDNLIISTLLAFIEQNGQSRFQNLNPRKDADGEAIEQNVINRAGFRLGNVFYVLPEAWKNQIFVGCDPKRATKIAFDKGFLRQEEKSGRMLSKKTFPALGATRCYVLKFEDLSRP